MLGMIKKWFKKKEVVENKIPVGKRPLDPQDCFNIIYAALRTLYQGKCRFVMNFYHDREFDKTTVTSYVIPLTSATTYDIPWKIFSLPPAEALKEIKEILGIKDEVNEPTK